MRKLKYKLIKYLIKKWDYDIPLPVINTTITPQDMKKFHAQHLVDWFEWKNSPFTPDCFIKGFKYQVVNDLLDEIIIKVEEKPEGVMYSSDLLLKNI